MIKQSDSLLDRLAMEYFTRSRKGHPPRYWVINNTPITPDLSGGSGEPVMARNQAAELKRHGIHVTYAPDSSDLSRTPGYDKTIGQLAREGKVDSWKALTDSPAWNSSKVRAWNGAEVPAEGIMDKFLKKPFRSFYKLEKAVRTGRFDHISPGRLRDFIKLYGDDVLNNPTLVGGDNLLADVAKSGRPAGFFNNFRGFPSSSWSAANGLSHGANFYDTHHLGVFNLGREANVVANYSAESDRLIPGTLVYRNWLNKHPLTAKASHAIDRRFAKKLIHQIHKDSKTPMPDLRGKKIIFMDSGSVGPNVSSKLQDLVDAVKNRNDVHILLQHGKTTHAPDLLGRNGVLAELQARNPGLITATERVPASAMGRLINGSDLHFAYGGSSSATEAASHLTPTIFQTDDVLNKPNSDFATKFRNALGPNKGKNFISSADNITTARWRALQNAMRGGRQLNANDLHTLAQQLTTGRRVTTSVEDLRRLLNDPTIVEGVRERNSTLIHELLSRKAQRQRYSRENIAGMRQYLKQLDKSNKNLVDSTRRAIYAAIAKDDARRAADIGKQLKALVGLNNARRGAAVRRIASSRGLRDLGLLLGGTISRTAIGRRLGALGLLASALAGGVYGANAKRNK